jgi:hypothetical protein
MERRGLSFKKENIIHKNSNNKRSDIATFSMNDPADSSNTQLIIDVSLAELRSHQAQASKALGVAKQREMEKHNKYDKVASRVQGKVVPFIIESPTGSIGVEGKKWLQSLQAFGPDHIKREAHGLQQDIQFVMVEYHKGLANAMRELARRVKTNIWE